ncbi:MAG: hypothetical protein CM1200mP3_10830 [Chloroflexota bacterium]|nr:MAG: hypothetical protein CM1200mP3_10830 [Chloroflexota bacterium]
MVDIEYDQSINPISSNLVLFFQKELILNDRLVSGNPHEDDHNLDTNLAKKLSTYVGQENLKSTFHINSGGIAKRRPLDHLFLGPPG